MTQVAAESVEYSWFNGIVSSHASGRTNDTNLQDDHNGVVQFDERQRV
jgi:hypothetical protein